jgi:hypothetical protein
MITPHAITEKLLFSTVKINTQNGSGTGFFFEFTYEGSRIPVLITNKHVIEASREISLNLHVADNNQPTDENVDVSYSPHWIKHPKYDLCCAFFQPLIEHCKTKLNKMIYYIPLDESIIWNKQQLSELKTMEDIIMVGYPIGLWDDVHNLPIFRKGITSSHPSVPFKGDNIGLIDAACFPGSSGSPICILNEGGYVDKFNNTTLGPTRFGLIGILYAGPTYDTQGKIIVQDIPTKQEVYSTTSVMINLGYYIKASEIFTLKNEVIKFIKGFNIGKV